MQIYFMDTSLGKSAENTALDKCRDIISNVVLNHLLPAITVGKVQFVLNQWHCILKTALYFAWNKSMYNWTRFRWLQCTKKRRTPGASFQHALGLHYWDSVSLSFFDLPFRRFCSSPLKPSILLHSADQWARGSLPSIPTSIPPNKWSSTAVTC